MSRNFLLEAGAKSEGEKTATGLKPRTTLFLNKHSTSLTKWLSVRLRTKWFWVRVQLQLKLCLAGHNNQLIHDVTWSRHNKTKTKPYF